MVLIFWGGFGQQNRWYIGPLITLAPLLLPLLGSGLLGLPLSLLSLLVSARHSTGAGPWHGCCSQVCTGRWCFQSLQPLLTCMLATPPNLPLHHHHPSVWVWRRRDVGVRSSHPDLAAAGLTYRQQRKQQQ